MIDVEDWKDIVRVNTLGKSYEVEEKVKKNGHERVRVYISAWTADKIIRHDNLLYVEFFPVESCAFVINV